VLEFTPQITHLFLIIIEFVEVFDKRKILQSFDLQDFNVF